MPVGKASWTGASSSSGMVGVDSNCCSVCVVGTSGSFPVVVLVVVPGWFRECCEVAIVLLLCMRFACQG